MTSDSEAPRPSAKGARGRVRGQRKTGEKSSEKSGGHGHGRPRARGRGIRRGRSGEPGHGQGCGRGWLQAEQNAEQHIVDHEQQLQVPHIYTTLTHLKIGAVFVSRCYSYVFIFRVHLM